MHVALSNIDDLYILFNVYTDEEIYHEKLPNIYEGIVKSAKNCCTTASVKKFIPIITWLPKYELNFLIPDFVAGVTVGLTAIPQAIVYGTIAGLTPQYGLYSAFMGCFVYIFFGTCKDVTIGKCELRTIHVHEKKTTRSWHLLNFRSHCHYVYHGPGAHPQC